MSKITKIPLPDENTVHHYVVASDWHSFFLNLKSYEILKKVSKLTPKEDTKLIIAGDFLDCEHLMGKKGDLTRLAKSTDTIEGLIEISNEEFYWGNKILNEMQECFSDIYFALGNHSWRYLNFMENYCPFAYKHNFDIHERLGLKERGIITIGYNDWFDVGNLSITHGMFHGSTHLKKHYEAAGGRSVMYGHVHHADCKSFQQRGNTVKAWSLPAMCDLNPEYMKNKDNNWTNGFATVQMKHNGNFNTHIHEIWDGELILPNGVIL